MNSADVFSLEFDILTRTSALAKTLDVFRTDSMAPGTHRQLLLELNHVINVHSRLREVAADVVPTEDWSAWQELLAVPALAFDQGRAFLDDLRALGLNSLDSVSLTPLPLTIAMARLITCPTSSPAGSNTIPTNGFGIGVGTGAGIGTISKWISTPSTMSMNVLASMPRPEPPRTERSEGIRVSRWRQKI